MNDNQLFKIVQANIGLAEERQKLVQNTLEEFGRIDALVNNAGIAPRVRNDITETTLSSFNEVLKINLEGPYFITQRVVSYWLNDKPEPLLPAGFKVIFVGSISAESVSTNRGEYCISKAGLDMVVKLWGVRLGVEGIQVVELRPGIMATDMTSKVKEKYDKLMEEGLVPQKRWGTADDMGLAAKAILTGQFPFTTGDVIHVDGGLHIHKF